MGEVDVVEQRPLVAPCELSIGTVDQLQTVLLIVGACTPARSVSAKEYSPRALLMFLVDH
jgi:hypothetical protein